MSFIAFLGCDGSGKSAVIAEVRERLASRGEGVWHGHWRPRAFENEKELSVKALATADDPHGQRPRGMVTSILKLGWLWLNWWLGWWRIWGGRSRSGVVLFDRFHADLVIDARRYRYGGPKWLAQVMSRLMPQPDMVVFLDADPDVLLSRKQEVTREALKESRKRYLEWCHNREGARVVDASRPLDVVVSEVMEMVEKKRGMTGKLGYHESICR